MDHLDDATVARLRSGGASPEETTAAMSHAAACSDCAARIGGVGQDGSGSGGYGAGSRSGSEPGAAGSAPLPRGTTVDRYLILHTVGEGGMGVVYAAYDPELDRKVALKLLRASATKGHGRAENQARLLREAQAMARVSHPNVTAVHDVGTYGDQIFVAMDLVEGADLRSWLKESRRPWRQVLDVLVSAGRGLAAAHAAGLVHRDFKPENVLVGKDGRVQVSDFGLARLADAVDLTPSPEAGNSSGSWDVSQRLLDPLTQSGVVVGTPSYMAPELHRGEAPDARSDQFSFCATLYYALYQKRALDPRRLAGLAEADSEAELPSRATLFGARRTAGGAGLIAPPPRDPWVPGWVKRAMMRGLSIAPEQRFPSMDALLAQLSRPPTTARNIRIAVGVALLAAAGYNVGQILERRQQAACGGFERRLEGIWDQGVAGRVEAAFTATGAPYAGRTFQSLKSTLDAYAHAWSSMRADACQATRVRGEQSEQVLALRMACLDRRLKELGALTGLLARADPKALERAVDAASALPPVAACGDVEALAASARPQDDPEILEEVARVSERVSEARVLLNAGRSYQGLPVAKQAVAAARRLGHGPLLSEALLQQGLLQIAEVDGPAAEQSLREAWQVAEESRDDEVRVRAAIGLSQSFANVSARLDLAREWGGIAEAALNRLGKPPELEILVRSAMGTLLTREGKYSLAREQYQIAIALVEHTRGPGDPEKLMLVGSASVCDYAEGHYKEGEAMLLDALALSERVDGPGHPHAAYLRNNLASMYLAMGDPGRALFHAREAVLIMESAMGRDHPVLSGYLHTEALALTRSGYHAESIPVDERALRLEEQSHGASHPDVAYMLEAMGEAYLGLGKPREAVPYLERAIAVGPPEPLLLADVRFQLARALVSSGGDRARARALAEKAREGYLSVGNKSGAATAQRWLAQPR